MAMIGERVSWGEFSGQHALVAGGSRGLGEATAKILAAGGGTPLITCHQGTADAERVVREITETGGTASFAL
ncbi:MAG: SDR family NAD(P)-dependent oxidoreductase [candidate division Zixibacteria bacterium]|nr:SDR family NAD(P)-dependent oxidoreductase [candidate division Zixibacteria bacterium]